MRWWSALTSAPSNRVTPAWFPGKNYEVVKCPSSEWVCGKGSQCQYTSSHYTPLSRLTVKENRRQDLQVSISLLNLFVQSDGSISLFNYFVQSQYSVALFNLTVKNSLFDLTVQLHYSIQSNSSTSLFNCFLQSLYSVDLFNLTVKSLC